MLTHKIKETTHLAKLYFITSIVKFPLVLSKNGILNGVIAISLIGCFLSGFSNILLSRLAKKTDQRSYISISSITMQKSHRVVYVTTLAFRILIIMYSVDLSLRFLVSAGISKGSKDLGAALLLGLLLIMSTLLPLKNNILFNSRNLLNMLVIASVQPLKTTMQPKVEMWNSSKKYFDSLGLTLACFTQQLGIVNSLEMGEKTILCGNALATAFYLAIGISGYISTVNPDVNWLLNIENDTARTISSHFLLLTNLLTYPLQIEPIREDLQAAFKTPGSKLLTVVFNIIITFLFVLFSSSYVASKFGAISCILLSSLVMLVFPTIFYLRSIDRQSILAFCMLGTGILLHFIGIKDLITALVK
ncbi:hypothetical protein GINT2_001606 [Glugoides intestinalis]